MISFRFFKKTITVTPQLIKYISVGITTQILDFLTYTLLVKLGILYIVADIINIPFTLTFNYFAHKYITFDQTKWSNKELSKYILNIIFNYFYATIILVISTNLFENPILGKILQILAVPLINYFILKRFVFKNN